MKKKETVVIGAGPAGLAAANQLIEQGNRPLVLEKTTKVGGISRTEEYKGYGFDIGGHRFFTKNDEINKLWQGLMGEDFIKVSRISRIFYRDRFFSYPIGLLNVIQNLGIIESLLIVLSFLKSKISPFIEENTFEQWVSNRFGTRLFQTFFKTYTEKIWGIPCNQIQANWAAQRIKGLSLVEAVINAMFGRLKSKSLIEEFDYPVKGPGMMWERFQKTIEVNGGEIRFEAKVKALEMSGNRIKSVLYTKNGSEKSIQPEHLVSSLPITKLIQIMHPLVPENVLKASQGLSYRSFIIVMLIVDQKELFPDQWIYIHDPEIRTGRIQNFKNWSAALVPHLDKTSVGMEFFCDKDDETWKMTDEELSELATKELDQLGLAPFEKVIDSYVVRQPEAYPVYDSEYDKSLAVIKEFIEGVENLQTIGRNGMHRYNNMDHSMLTGILAAKNIAGSSFDLWSINEENEYLESKIPENIPEKLLTRTFARLDKLAFGTATGFTCGLLVFLATIWLVIKGGSVIGPNMQLLGQYFVGYTVTAKGAFIAFGHGFAWGWIFGWLFAFLRNTVLSYFIFRVRRKREMLTVRDFLDRL